MTMFLVNYLVFVDGLPADDGDGDSWQRKPFLQEPSERHFDENVRDLYELVNPGEKRRIIMLSFGDAELTESGEKGHSKIGSPDNFAAW